MRFIAAIVCICLLGAPLLARAERSFKVETVNSATPNGKPAVTLLVNGQPVARLAKPAVVQGVQRSPQRGAALAAALITEAWRTGHGDITVKLGSDGRTYAVMLNGKLLLLATNAEGKAWGATPEELASSWRSNLQLAWDPGVVAGESKTQEPVPVQRDTTPRTQAPSAPVYTPRQPRQDPPPPAEPAITQDSSLLVEADEPGAGTVRPAKADNGDAPEQPKPAPAKPAPTSPPAPTPSADMGRLEVKPGQRAYDPPQSISMDPVAPPGRFVAQVTGASPPAAIVTEALESALRTSAGLPSGATIIWTPSDPEFVMPALTTGTRVTVPLTYKVNGMGEPVPAEVTVENRTLRTPRESATFFSNAPENVKRQQLLYHAQLPAGQSARLVYHHMNQSGGRLDFIARVVNTTGETAALHVVPGEFAPNINTFFVGFKSAENFWSNLSSGSGYVLSVPAGGQAYVIAQPMQPGYTASGYYKLSNLTRGALRIETLALAPQTVPPSGPWPSADGASAGVFPEPYLSSSEGYTANCDTPWLYLRLGEEMPDSSTDDSVHYGCYGVTHSYSVEITNPTQSPALVFVILRASAGEVKGQFYIDDEYIATALVSGGDEQLLKEVPVKPGATRKLRIQAIALNGGFYPASIIIRESRLP